MRTLLIIISLLAGCTLYGQNVPKITVSQEKVNVNGTIMLVHKVQGGETLYSIAKAYNVTIDEIVRQNEILKAGLKEGTTIYIPSSNAPKADTSVQTPAPKAAATESPAKGEVKEGAKEVTAPQVAVQPQPAAKIELQKDELKKYSRKKKHTVKWYETIEDVAEKYNVPVDAIVSLNNLQTTMLKKKQQLYIPNDEFLTLLESMNTHEQEEENPLDKMELEGQGVEISVEQPKTKKEFDILYILPLNLNDTIAPNSNFMDFYMGALMSVESRKEHNGENIITDYPSKKINITLVDQQMYSSIEEIISTGVLENKDVIVGPVKPADLQKVLSATEDKSIVFSPIDQAGEKLVEGNPYLVQVPPTINAQQENIINLFASKCTPDKNAVIIYETGAVDTTLLRMAKNTLATKGIGFKTLSYGILEGREILNKMGSYMIPQAENNVLVLSGSEAFVSDVVRNLNLLHTNPVEENRRKITLFGLPRWRNFETIEVDYFHRMNLHLSLPYFVDYSSQEVKDFIMKYRALFGSEPTAFAFQGYDVGKMAKSLNYAARPVEKLAETMNYMLGLNLQVKHSYKRNGAGNGMTNTGTRNIVYNTDYTISEL